LEKDLGETKHQKEKETIAPKKKRDLCCEEDDDQFTTRREKAQVPGGTMSR